ncbi:MAG: TolC family protein, partial [Burkholderiales bacterium]|nr:TolC family protein [Burkholderiales bacterium]
MNKKALPLALLTLTLGGCATIAPNAGFDEVRTDVAQRIDKRVQWRSGSTEDEAVTSEISELLKKELDVESAVQIALLNNRNLQATYEQLGISQANLVQAGLLRNPVFSAAILFPSGGGGRAELDFGIAQDFLSLFYLPLNKRLAGARFEAAKLQVSAAVLGLALDVRSQFYRTQAASQMVELFQQVVANTEASYVFAKRLREAGNITDLVLYQERTLYEESRLGLAAAETSLAIEREQLTALMGLWGGDTHWKVAPRLPEIPEDETRAEGFEARAIEASLSLAARRKQIEAAATGLGFANATALIPSFAAGFQAEREDDWERGPSFSFRIPIFDAGQARRFAARAQLRQAQAEYAALAVATRSAARTAYIALNSARDRALFVKNVVLPLRSQIVDKTFLQYNAMQVGVFQLLQAQREQVAAAR